jgi:nucleoid DNA-binding protein
MVARIDRMEVARRVSQRVGSLSPEQVNAVLEAVAAEAPSSEESVRIPGFRQFTLVLRRVRTRGGTGSGGPGSRAPGKKAPATAPAKKAPAKKAPAKKAPAEKAAAKKAPAVKAPAKKAPVKKAPAVKKGTR